MRATDEAAATIRIGTSHRVTASSGDDPICGSG
jgi:hypothetical protein